MRTHIIDPDNPQRTLCGDEGVTAGGFTWFVPSLDYDLSVDSPSEPWCEACQAKMTGPNLAAEPAPPVDLTPTAPDEPPGEKVDGEKVRWDLLPWTAVEAVAAVVDHGARKYAPDNWRKITPMRRRYVAAAMRHLTAYLRGEKVDPDSGDHHLAQAATSLLFVLEVELEGEIPPALEPHE